jgi:hypothetical protein
MFLTLTQKLTKTTDPQYREHIMRFIEPHSPVAWAHISSIKIDLPGMDLLVQWACRQNNNHTRIH